MSLQDKESDPEDVYVQPIDRDYDEGEDEDDWEDSDDEDEDDEEGGEDEWPWASTKKLELNDPVPVHLIPPMDVLVMIMEHLEKPELIWKMRLVCRDWHARAESLARTHWPSTLDPCLHFRQHSAWFDMDHTISPSGIATFFSKSKRSHSPFNFMKEGDRKKFGDACRRCAPPAVELGTIVQDPEIPSMKYDWDNLTITVSWRDLLVHILGDELLFARIHAHNIDQLRTWTAEVQAQKPEANFVEMATTVQQQYKDQNRKDYCEARGLDLEGVRMQRMKGREKWLKDLRDGASWKEDEDMLDKSPEDVDGYYKEGEGGQDLDSESE